MRVVCDKQPNSGVPFERSGEPRQMCRSAPSASLLMEINLCREALKRFVEPHRLNDRLYR